MFFSLMTSAPLSRCVKSDAAGDSEFLVRNETARVVSSSSFSGRHTGSTSAASLQDCWWMFVKDGQETGTQTRESSEKGDVLAKVGEAGLSGEGASACGVSRSKYEVSVLWLFISRLSMRESKLSTCGWGLLEEQLTAGGDNSVMRAWLSEDDAAAGRSAVNLMLRMLKVLQVGCLELGVAVSADS